MSLGPWLFTMPWALIGLLALPIIWLVLRATPPAPKQAELPSLRLLEKIDTPDTTPDRTPWWVLALRLAAIMAAILGLAGPVYSPERSDTETADGPVLVVVDDGWTSGPRWSDIRAAAQSGVAAFDRDTQLHLLTTAPRGLQADPTLPMTREAYTDRIRALSPAAWPADRETALTRLSDSNLRPSQILWVSDGLDTDSAEPFIRALSALAPLTVHIVQPRGPIRISSLSSSSDSADITLQRLTADTALKSYVSGVTIDGRAIATAPAEFAIGATETTARFDLPAAALARVDRFTLIGTDSAAGVWMWDSASRTRRVGLVSGDAIAQPLLSDLHYVRKALEPFANISEGSLSRLVESDPDAIILTDIGQIDPDTYTAVEAWVESGGALIRFAGPRMAANSDSLIPTPLRRASRAIGGALTWEQPQALGAFPGSSPFFGLPVPEDVRIRQQVLARPGPELTDRTWAELADGSPLITADTRGDGMIILFHVTAGPDWSDLPYSGTFVDLLRRAIAAGKGEATVDSDGLYTPARAVNGFGEIVAPGALATPLQASTLAETVPSEAHPPGLYTGPGGGRALNLGQQALPSIVENWPTGITLRGDSSPQRINLGGVLLGLAASLLLIDILVALGLAGRLFTHAGRATAAIAIVITASTSLPGPAEAQTIRYRTPVDNGEESKALSAALDMRLAYILTGDAEADRVTEAGLNGLTSTLFARSSVEPADPHAVDPETDSLDVYPILFLSFGDNPTPLSARAIARLNAYMRAGGALFIDTRNGDDLSGRSNFDSLETVLSGLDSPTLAPVPENHVISRSFYLLDDFPGRYAGRPLWIETTGSENRDERRGDGVSRLFITDADYLAAWAVDDFGRPTFTVDGGDTQREFSKRFGVNLIVYVLTGNYKEDQVHIPALLERLGNEDESEEDFPIFDEDLP